MEGMYAYNRYSALKLHFTSDYDFFKYNGQIRQITESALQTRKDYDHLRRLERRYKNDSDLDEFIIANLVHNGECKWPGDLVKPEAEKIYKKWKALKESFTYEFSKELKRLAQEPTNTLCKVTNGGHPQLLSHYLGKRVSIETLIGLDEVIGFTDYWNKNISDTVIWPDVYKLIYKYKPFLNLDHDKLEKALVEAFWS